MQIAGPLQLIPAVNTCRPKELTFDQWETRAWGKAFQVGTQEFLFPKCSQEMLMLPVLRPHFEHWDSDYEGEL